MRDPKTYPSLSAAELEVERRELLALEEDLKLRLRAVARFFHAKRGLARAVEKVKAMSDPERERLAQALGAAGIPSGETVGKPGAARGKAAK